MSVKHQSRTRNRREIRGKAKGNKPRDYNKFSYFFLCSYGNHDYKGYGCKSLVVAPEPRFIPKTFMFHAVIRN